MYKNSYNNKLNIHYTKLLKNFSQYEITKKDDNKYSLFYPLCGTNYQRDIMIIGRAVNGWVTFELSQMTDDDQLFDILNKVKNKNLSWVTDSFGKGPRYKTSKSPFWRVIKNILFSFEINYNESNWSQSIVWSNLYKISLKKGNPPVSLMNFQEATCLEMLKDEIDLFKPKNIIFITGLDWCDKFLNHLNCNMINKELNDTVEALCTLNTHEANELTKIIVTCRPEGKKEDIFVNDIINAFKSI